MATVLLDTGASGTFATEEIGTLLPQETTTNLTVTTVTSTNCSKFPIITGELQTTDGTLFPIKAYSLPALSKCKQPPLHIIQEIRNQIPEKYQDSVSTPPDAPLDLIVGTNYVELQGKTVDKDYKLPGLQFYKSPLARQEYMIGTLKTTDPMPQPEPNHSVFMALTATHEDDPNSSPLTIDVGSFLKTEPMTI